MDRRLSEKINGAILTVALGDPPACYVVYLYIGWRMDLILPPSVQHTGFRSPGVVSTDESMGC